MLAGLLAGATEAVAVVTPMEGKYSNSVQCSTSNRIGTSAGKQWLRFDYKLSIIPWLIP